VSASERLKALDKPLPPSVEPPGHKGYVLANALPQIVAVVEAAEQYLDTGRGDLDGVLAALDEALS
jgi:hypothetical protein